MLFGLTLFACLLMWYWLQTSSEVKPRKALGALCVAFLLAILSIRVLVDTQLISLPI